MSDGLVAPVYGVPRGGAVVAGLLLMTGVSVVDDPAAAATIVDDVYETGGTMRRVNGLLAWLHQRSGSMPKGYPAWRFLVDKRVELRDAWVQFPWERDDEEATSDSLLLEAVREHWSQRADDRCWEDDDRLYAAAGLPPVDRRVGDKAAMLENCQRYIDRRCEGGGWPTYRELEAELARLRAIQVGSWTGRLGPEGPSQPLP